jgi:fibronectin type 3 domain-containing protein
MKYIAMIVALLLSTLAYAQTAPYVLVQWTQSASKPLAYNTIYRSTVSGGPYTPIFQTTGPTISYQDNSVSSGSTYCYVVTATGQDGFESVQSNESCVTLVTAPVSNVKASAK